MCLFVLVSKSAARLVNRLSLLPVAVACGGLQQHVAAVVAVAVAVAVVVLSLVFRIDVSRLPN